MTQEMPQIGDAEGSMTRPARGSASTREGVDAEVARIIELIGHGWPSLDWRPASRRVGGVNVEHAQRSEHERR